MHLAIIKGKYPKVDVLVVFITLWTKKELFDLEVHQYSF